MQATMATHSMTGLLTPEHLFVIGFLLLGALILFALSVEAGNYPGIHRRLQNTRGAVRQLRNNWKSRSGFSGRGHVAGR